MWQVSWDPPPFPPTPTPPAQNTVIQVTPVAEARLSNAGPFRAPLVTHNNKLIIPTAHALKGFQAHAIMVTT
jgi:hypothetical protein